MGKVSTRMEFGEAWGLRPEGVGQVPSPKTQVTSRLKTALSGPITT